MSRRWLKVGMLCLLVASMIAVARAVSADPLPLPSNAPIVYNPGSTPFDPALTANVAEAVAGHSGRSVFDTATPPTYLGVNTGEAVGSLFSGTPGQAIDIADGATGGAEPRPGIRLAWKDKYLLNGPGDDFVIAESGSWAGAEYYVIAVKPSGAALTNFYFEPPNAFEGIEDKGTAAALDPEDTGHFLAAVDLASLGIPEGVTVEYVEIYKVLATDTFADGGGYVGCGDEAPRLPEQLDSNAPGPIAENRYDADIHYVFALDADRLADSEVKLDTTVGPCMQSLAPSKTPTGTPKP